MKKALEILKKALYILKAVKFAAEKLIELFKYLSKWLPFIKKKDTYTMSEIEREFKEAEKRKDVK